MSNLSLANVTSIHSNMISPNMTKGAAPIPQMMAAQGSRTEQPAVIETKPRAEYDTSR